MGCLHTGRLSASRGTSGLSLPAVDVLVTQSHSLQDATAAALARWLRGSCHQGGLDAFYEEGISANAFLKPKQRRRLRDAFEAARCVAAAAVSRAALGPEQEKLPPLSNEVLWAEQNNKPIVLLYDDARPFRRHEWEEKWPDLFRLGCVVRYYGHGHEVCRDGVLSALRDVMAAPGDEDPNSDMAWRGKHTVRAAKKVGSTAAGAEDSALDATAAVVVARAAEQSNMDLQAALSTLRAAQAAATPALEAPAEKKSGILRNSAVSQQRRPSGAPFRPTEEHVRRAARSVVAELGTSAAAPREVVMECLKAGVGVSDQVTSTALRVLNASLLREPPRPGPEASDAADWALVALTRHGDSLDVCAFAAQLLANVAHALQATWLSSQDAGVIAGILREYPGCRALQHHTFSFLARLLASERPSGLKKAYISNGAADKDVQISSGGGEATLALRGGGLTRILTRLNVAELAAIALARHHEDDDLAVDACAVLQNLASVSREVKIYLSSGEMWLPLLIQSQLNSAVVIASMRVLSSLVTEDEDAKDALGAEEELLRALERRLQKRRSSAVAAAAEADTSEECTEVFGLLCRLTARHPDNKSRCLDTDLPRRAVEYCNDRKMSDETRLAAGGFLVNLCGEEEARQHLLEIGASRAAAVLRLGSNGMVQCGEALDKLLGYNEDELEMPAKGASEEPTASAFDGLFAVRRSTQGGSKRSTGSLPPVPRLNLHGAGAEDRRNHAVDDRDLGAAGKREARGAGWQRRHKAGNAASGEGDDGQMDTLSDAGAASTARSVGNWVPTGLASHPVLVASPRPEEELPLAAVREPHMSPRNLSDFDDLDNQGSPKDAAGEATRVAKAPGRGLKGNKDMRSRLAGVRAAADAEAAAAAAPKRSGLFSLGKSATKPAARQLPEALSFDPPDRRKEAEMAQLALAASSKARGVVAETSEFRDDEVELDD